MNTSHKGRAYEWELRRELVKRDWLVTRSAASKGPFDLITVKPGKIGFIQAKAGRFSCAAAARLADEMYERWSSPGFQCAVVHECRKGCKWNGGGHVPMRFCFHIRPGDVP